MNDFLIPTEDGLFEDEHYLMVSRSLSDGWLSMTRSDAEHTGGTSRARFSGTCKRLDSSPLSPNEDGGNCCLISWAKNVEDGIQPRPTWVSSYTLSRIYPSVYQEYADKMLARIALNQGLPTITPELEKEVEVLRKSVEKITHYTSDLFP